MKRNRFVRYYFIYTSHAALTRTQKKLLTLIELYYVQKRHSYWASSCCIVLGGSKRKEKPRNVSFVNIIFGKREKNNLIFCTRTRLFHCLKKNLGIISKVITLCWGNKNVIESSSFFQFFFFWWCQRTIDIKSIISINVSSKWSFTWEAKQKIRRLSRKIKQLSHLLSQVEEMRQIRIYFHWSS